jgi:hypothetical protein
VREAPPGKHVRPHEESRIERDDAAFLASRLAPRAARGLQCSTAHDHPFATDPERDSSTMSFSLQDFDLPEMLRCGLDLRRAAQGAKSMEEAAEAVVRYLYERCVDTGTGDHECALVRFYKTHPYGDLPRELQRFAADLAGEQEPRPEMRCLVLLATAGQEPAWNFRHTSARHQAIPLPSAEMVERAPMISQLIRELGADLDAVISPAPAAPEAADGKTYNVFYVPEAVGSPFIPAQEEFVRRFGIRSVVGFGGQLFSGSLYSVILFTRVPVPHASAQRFRNIALDLKVAVSMLEEQSTFREVPFPEASP